MNEWIDTIVKVFGVAGTIGTAFLGAKIWQWRAQLRQLNAEASQAESAAASGQASATETMVQTALLLGNPELVRAIGSRLTVLEHWAEDVRAWDIDQLGDWQRRSVAHTRAFLALAAANGWDLSSLPPVPGPPPEPPPYPRPGSTT